MRAVITDNRFGNVSEERDVLDPLGIDLEVAQCRSSADVGRACADADAVLVNMAPVDAEAIAAMQNCRVIARYGIGLDNIDLDAAQKRNIKVYNVTGYCDDDVAQHALGMLLAMLRDIPGRNAAVHNGAWNLPAAQYTVAGASIGVLGFGGSGKAFTRSILALNPARIMVYSPSTDQAKLDAQLGSLASLMGIPLIAVTRDRLLAEASIIAIHLRLCDDTRALFNDDAFARMRRGSFLVNTARGAIIDPNALQRALDSGIISGAALDVLDTEPPPIGHPLLGHPRVLLSDHCAYRSVRSIHELKRRTAENAARGLGLLPPE